METLIGKRLGQYEIISKIGSGGMATVYMARQLSVDRHVAIKVIRSDMMEEEEFASRFQREARTIASLSHPHILKLFDFGHEGNLAYLVMELMDGGSLSKLVRSQGALQLDQVARLVEQFGGALDYAHQRGIIHRDLKPDNVLLDKQQNAFLTDFGIAKLLNETTNITRSGTVMGTPTYMAPELWSGMQADVRTDLYALAVMMFEMLTGKSPFAGDTPFRIMHMHIYEPPPLTRSIIPTMPEAVDALLGKALAKDRDQRFSSAGEMAAVLRNIARGQGYTMFPTPGSGNAYRPPTPTPGGGIYPTPNPQQSILTDMAPATGYQRSPTPGSGWNNVPLPGTVPNAALQPPAPSMRSRNTGWIVIGAVIVLLVAVAAVLLLSQAGNSGQNAGTQTQQAAVFNAATNISGTATGLAIAAQSATATPQPPSATTAAVAQQVTVTASSSSTLTLTFTTTPTATYTLTATATLTPTATASPTATNTSTPTIDAAVVVAQTLAPIQSQTAQARNIQKTVDAILAANNATAALQQTQTAVVQNTADAQQIKARAAVNAQQTLNAAAQATSAQRLLNTQAAANQQTAVAINATATALAYALQNPTITPYIPPTTPAPTTRTCPGFMPSRVVIGGYARVTPGDPNRLRDGPGGNWIVDMPAGSVMLVLDGPECTTASDGPGIAWWKVQWRNPEDGRTYTGWTAEGKGTTYFLEPVGAGAENIPTSVTGVIPAETNRYSVPSGATRLGEFQVEWYCNGRGYGVALTNSDRDWACTDKTTGTIIFTLRVADFDSICRSTYNTSGAFAIRDQNRSTQAYNWSCYSF